MKSARSQARAIRAQTAPERGPYVIDPPLFAVADGMGGAQAGEIASKLAASAVRGGDPVSSRS